MHEIRLCGLGNFAMGVLSALRCGVRSSQSCRVHSDTQTGKETSAPEQGRETPALWSPQHPQPVIVRWQRARPGES